MARRKEVMFPYSRVNKLIGDVLVKERFLKDIKEFNPEMIVLSICGIKSVSPESLKKRKGWQEIDAVKNDNIHVFDDSLLNRPGPRLVVGCKKLYEMVAGCQKH